MSFSLKKYAADAPFFVFAGPCVIENEELTLKIAFELKRVAEKLGLPAVFKASFDKANRTSGDSFRGPGLEKGLEILSKVKQATGLPCITDIHLPDQAERISQVCDIIQIPAFLCRQSDLTDAAAKFFNVVNIKKGQFLSPWATDHLVKKVKAINPQAEVLLTERGASFGYGNLVVDMRSFPIMSEFADAVVYDATHSLQLPSAGQGKTGGQREYVPALARAAVATGSVDGLFLEIHPEPETSPSDADNILALEDLENLLASLIRIKKAI